MDQTHELLQNVITGARTGLNGCQQLLERTQDEAMRTELLNQCSQYLNFARDAETALFAAGSAPQPLPTLARAGMWAGIQFNTMIDTTPSHIADMAIQGAAMGVISMTRSRSELSDASPDAQSIASHFVTFQQENIERMKAFL